MISISSISPITNLPTPSKEHPSVSRSHLLSDNFWSSFEPDKINSKTVESITYEVWGYLLTNKYFNDLELEFLNGKLKGIKEK